MLFITLNTIILNIFSFRLFFLFFIMNRPMNKTQCKYLLQFEETLIIIVMRYDWIGSRFLHHLNGNVRWRTYRKKSTKQIAQALRHSLATRWLDPSAGRPRVGRTVRKERAKRPVVFCWKHFVLDNGSRCDEDLILCGATGRSGAG